MRRHWPTLALLLSLVVTACSSGDGVDSTTTTSPGSNGDTTTTVSPTTTTTTTTLPVGDPVVRGADPIELLTPTSGGGIRPLLVWTPVPSAATYTIIVYDAAGAPYWSAVTIETQVYVGGPLQIPADRTGPTVAEGYTWAVYADDADGSFLAASPLRDIAP